MRSKVIHYKLSYLSVSGLDQIIPCCLLNSKDLVVILLANYLLAQLLLRELVIRMLLAPLCILPLLKYLALNRDKKWLSLGVEVTREILYQVVHSNEAFTVFF